jgi:hypothetical protein
MAYDQFALFFRGTEAITNSAVTSKAIFVGERLADIEVPIDVRVKTTFGSGTSLTLSLIESATENLGTPTTLYSTAAIGVSTLVAGYKFNIPKIPKGPGKYIGIVATPEGTFDAGRLFGGIQEGVTSDQFVPTSPPAGSRL